MEGLALSAERDPQESTRTMVVARSFWVLAQQGKVLSGIIHGTRSGLPRVDALTADGPHKTP